MGWEKTKPVTTRCDGRSTAKTVGQETGKPNFVVPAADSGKKRPIRRTPHDDTPQAGARGMCWLTAWFLLAAQTQY